MLNYGELKINELLASNNWDDHTENDGLQEFIGGWTIEGVQLLKNDNGYTTDVLLVLKEPGGPYRVMNISNPNQSQRGPKYRINGPIRIEVERLPGEPILKKPRALFWDMMKWQRAKGKTEKGREAWAEELEEWYSAGKITITELDRLEAVEEIDKFKPIFEKLAAAGLWEEFIYMAGRSLDALPLALSMATKHAQEIEPELWRDFVIDCFSMLEDDNESVRASLATLPKIPAEELPEELSEEVIEVYQDTTIITGLTAFSLGQRPAWIYDREEARGRYENGSTRFGSRLYRGELRREDIIAINEDTKEVLQLDSVRNIKLIGDGENLDFEDGEEVDG